MFFYSKRLLKISFNVIIALAIILSPIYVYASEITSSNLIELANSDRENANLTRLENNGKLSLASFAKASDMLKNNYFEHYSPTGLSPWIFISNAHYNYYYAGENLAMGFRTAEGTHNAWMNSPTHRANILNANYSDVGVTVMYGELLGRNTTLVVEMFGRESKNILEKSSKIAVVVANYLFSSLNSEQ